MQILRYQKENNMFNWQNCKIFDYPYRYVICDDFLNDYDDTIFPDESWTKQNLSKRENNFTYAISAKQSLSIVPKQTKILLSNILSQEFHNYVCNLLEINLTNESTGIRRTHGDYRIAREAQLVENYYTENNILDPHYDNEVTIWTALLYFVDSKYGSFNIHDGQKNLLKQIPIKKNRLIITYNSANSWHSVSPWLEKTPRKSIYTTAEFKNYGRDADRKPIGAVEKWIK